MWLNSRPAQLLIVILSAHDHLKEAFAEPAIVGGLVALASDQCATGAVGHRRGCSAHARAMPLPLRCIVGRPRLGVGAML